MTLLATLVRWEIEIFLIALAATVAIKLLNGEINTKYLLYGRISGRPEATARYFSPERVQLLAVTIMAALDYLAMTLNNATPGQFPPVPESLPAIVGGSNILYLGGKAYARWLGK